MGAVAMALLGELAFAVVKLRRVKRGAAQIATLPVRRAWLGSSATVGTPTAIGYLHPAIIVPDGFRDQLDAGEWEAIVAHESAHLARCDDWAKAIQSTLVRLAWWLPGLWVVGRALDLERELASDERAIGETGARRYAACLLRLATESRAHGPALAFWGRRAQVAIRVERLLRPSPGRGVLKCASGLMAFGSSAMATLTAAAFILPGTVLRTEDAPARALQPQAVSIALAIRHPGSLRRPATSRALPAASAQVLARIGADALAAAVTAPRVRLVVAPLPRLTGRAALAAAKRKAPAHPMGIAFAPLPAGCTTCFGPLRTSDDAIAPNAVPPAKRAAPGASLSAIAADEAMSLPVSLDGQSVWLRLPARVTAAPN